MPSLASTVKLNTGAEMPVIGLGTWKAAPGEVEHAVEHALKVGYKNIDTATAYENEAEVGQGIKASGVKREDMFLTTKLNNPDHKNVEEALKYSLKTLDTPYLDLCKHRTSLQKPRSHRCFGNRAHALGQRYDLQRECFLHLFYPIQPAPMTKEMKADKSHDWLDTWKDMEKVYQEHPDKVKAIGVC